MNAKRKKIILNTNNGRYVEKVEFIDGFYSAKETWNKEWARLFDGDKARSFVNKLNKKRENDYKVIPFLEIFYE